MDPPFKPIGEDCFAPPEFHSSKPHQGSTDTTRKKSHSMSNLSFVVGSLSSKISQSPSAIDAARSDCFFILEDIYRLAALNWLVINEYVRRELATMGYVLERQEPGFQDLESYLKDLYIYNRRFTKYRETIARMKEECANRGQHPWAKSSHSGSNLAAEHARALEIDFQYLEKKFQATGQKVDKSISLLTTLVAIEEAKQARDENHGVARLSFLAIVFLPFSTVATVLSMQGTYAPGQSQFGLFWIVALSLTAVVIGLLVLYEKVASHWKKWVARLSVPKLWKRRKILPED